MTGPASVGGRRLLGDATIIQVGRALQILLNLVTFVVLARGLGAEGFGVFSTIVASLAIGFALADLGLGQLSVRAAAQKHAEEIVGIRQAVPALYLASSLVIAVASAASWMLTGLHGQAFLASGLIGVSYVLVQARIGVERGFWLGRLQVVRATGIELVSALLRAVSVVLVWSTSGSALMAYAAAIAISGAATLGLVQWRLTFPVAMAEAAHSRVPRTLREALPFALSSLTWTMLVETPKLLLAPLVGLSSVGLFSAGSRMLAVANLPLQSVLNVVTPRVFAATTGTSQTSRPSLRVFLRWASVVTTLGAALAIAIALVSPVLPLVIGNDYTAAVPVLRILAISLPFQALAFASGDWLAGIGRQPLRVQITVGVLVVSVPLLYFIVRDFGAAGAAYGFVAATAILAVASAVACWRLAQR